MRVGSFRPLNRLRLKSTVWLVVVVARLKLLDLWWTLNQRSLWQKSRFGSTWKQWTENCIRFMFVRILDGHRIKMWALSPSLSSSLTTLESLSLRRWLDGRKFGNDAIEVEIEKQFVKMRKRFPLGKWAKGCGTFTSGCRKVLWKFVLYVIRVNATRFC